MLLLDFTAGVKMRHSTGWLGTFVALTLLGCSSDETTEAKEPQSTSAAQTQAIVALDFGASAAATVLSQFMSSGAQLQKSDKPLADSHGGGDGDGGLPPDDAGTEPPPTPDQVKTTIGDDVTGGAPSACVSFMWTTGLSATVTFNGCQYGTTSVNGQLGLAVTLSPTTFAFTFSDLKVDSVKIDGSATLRFGGTELAPSTSIDTNVSFDVGGTTQLKLSFVTATRSPTGTILDGAGSLTTGGASWVFSMAQVDWNKGDCHPSSGSAILDQGLIPITIGFLPKTPAEGVVSLQLGSGQPFEQAVLTPCSSS